tara:strand:+ start:181 stop:606 length:426 start_codon:yes stop_codon:yes gene_type:complete
MYKKTMLGLEQSQSAIDAMIKHHQSHPEMSAIAVAVVDDVGLLIAYARTDGSRTNISKNAIKKAYTAAIRGMNTEDYEKMLEGRGWRVADFGDPMLIAVPGGIAIHDPSDGSVIGGIGVAGLPPGSGDDDMALIGLEAMNL